MKKEKYLVVSTRERETMITMFEPILFDSIEKAINSVKRSIADDFGYNSFEEFEASEVKENGSWHDIASCAEPVFFISGDDGNGCGEIYAIFKLSEISVFGKGEAR